MAREVPDHGEMLAIGLAVKPAQHRRDPFVIDDGERIGLADTVIAPTSPATRRP